MEGYDLTGARSNPKYVDSLGITHRCFHYNRRWHPISATRASSERIPLEKRATIMKCRTFLAPEVVQLNIRNVHILGSDIGKAGGF